VKFKTLTTMEKIMNMAKLGTVSQEFSGLGEAKKPLGINAMRCSLYTLCAKQVNRTWNG
jgi:hypothetical protein